MYLVSRTRTLSAKDLEDAAKYKLKDNWYMFSSQLEEINLSSTEISMKRLPWGKQAPPINTSALPLKTREMSTIRSLGWVYRIKAKIFFCVLIMMNADIIAKLLLYRKQNRYSLASLVAENIGLDIVGNSPSANRSFAQEYPAIAPSVPPYLKIEAHMELRDLSGEWIALNKPSKILRK